MKNKIITIAIMAFSLFQMQGFGQADTVKEKTVYNAIMRSNMISQIIGEWRVSGTFVDIGNIRGMVCPVITFSDNYLATNKNCAKEKESYKWEIQSDTLHLEYVGDPQKEPYFSATTYKMVITDHKTYLKLTLYSSETSGYILLKEIKP